MNYPDSLDPWAISNRSAMLIALKEVLKTEMVGIKTVRRSALSKDCIAETSLPAVLITEISTKYSWDNRHGENALRSDSVLIFDLQGECRKKSHFPEGDQSEAREALVAAFLRVLQNNPMLLKQLGTETEPEAHAHDVFQGADVRYPDTKYPKFRALVTIKVTSDENFKETTAYDWRELILTVDPCDPDSILTNQFEVENG